MGHASFPTSSINLESADYKSSATLLIPHQYWNLLEKRKRNVIAPKIYLPYGSDFCLYLKKSSSQEFVLRLKSPTNEKKSYISSFAVVPMPRALLCHCRFCFPLTQQGYPQLHHA